MFQDDVYKNGNILEPEIIPFCLIYVQYILCYGLISIETLKSYFLCMFFSNFPKFYPSLCRYHIYFPILFLLLLIHVD